MKVVVAVLSLSLGLVVTVTPSEACVPIGNLPFATDPAQAADTTPPTPVVFCHYFTSHTEEGDPNTCGGLGYFHVVPDSTDDLTAKSALGYIVQRAGEAEPAPVRLEDGELLIRFDANQDHHVETVTITPVDLNGNRGEPQDCKLEWINPTPESGGCASSRGGGWLVVGLALLGLVRRRATRA